MTARFRFSKNRQNKASVMNFWVLTTQNEWDIFYDFQTLCWWCNGIRDKNWLQHSTVIPMVTKCLCKRQHFLGHIPTALFPVPVILLGHMEELLIHCLKEWKTKIYYHLEKWSRTWWKNPFHLHVVLDFALPSFSPALHTCF